MDEDIEQPRSGAFNWRGVSRAEIVGFAAYSVILAALTIKHTFWRDETEAWLIARASPNPIALLHNAAYEGHPPLWYLILFGITRFTWNVEWMKLPNFLSSLVAALLVLRAKAPQLVLRLGMVFSYFILFEYGVIARNYMIGVVFLLAAVTLMKRPYPASVLYMLSLVALTSLPALIVALFLSAYYLYVVLAETDTAKPGFSLTQSLRSRVIAAVVFILSAVISVATIRPPSDSAILLESRRSFTGAFHRILEGGFLLGRGYLTLPDWRHDFWDFTRVWTLKEYLLTSAFGWIALLAFASFLKNRPVRWFYLLATASLVVELNYSGKISQRHVGWLFVVFMSALLLDGESNRAPLSFSTTKSAFTGSVVAIVLVCQVVVGVFAVGVGLRYPFSSSKEVAAYLRQEHLDQAPFVPRPFYSTESVLAYLQRPYATNLQLGRQMSYVIWDRNELLNRTKLPDRRAFHALGRNGELPILITDYPLTQSQQAGLDVRSLASFTGAICANDRYFLYRENNQAPN